MCHRSQILHTGSHEAEYFFLPTTVVRALLFAHRREIEPVMLNDPFTRTIHTRTMSVRKQQCLWFLFSGSCHKSTCPSACLSSGSIPLLTGTVTYWPERRLSLSVSSSDFLNKINSWSNICCSIIQKVCSITALIQMLILHVELYMITE